MGSRYDTYQPYIGSVRFFKHIILAILTLLIVVPISICIVLFNKEAGLRAEYTKQSQLVLEQADKLLKQPPAPSLADAGNSSPPESNVASAPKARTKISQDWRLIIVNDRTSLPEDFTVNLAYIGDGQSVDARIVTPLNDMMKAADKDGIHIRIYSSYRSMEKQLGLFNASVSQYLADGDYYNQAFYKTKQKIALPSESEHQTGLMVDIIGLGQTSVNDMEDNISQGNTPEMKWLRDNCADYGFICRYPAGKTAVTGIDYEPYCFRYVGKEAARSIMDSGITLEEYVQINSSN